MSTQTALPTETNALNAQQPPQEPQIPLDVKELFKGPALGQLLMQAAQHKIESTLKNDQSAPGEKKGESAPAPEPIAHVSLNLNKHLPPVQVNLHANQAPTASFVQQPAPFQQPPANITQHQQQPVNHSPPPMMINLEALLGMFCGGRPEHPPAPAPHLSSQAPGIQNPHVTQDPQANKATVEPGQLQSQPQPQTQQSSGMFSMGFLKNLPFVGSSSQHQTQQPAGPSEPQNTSGQTTSKAPLMFHRPEGSKENELILLPSRSTQAGSQDASAPVPPPPVISQPAPTEPVRTPFQPTLPAGTQPQVPQQQQSAPFIDLGSLLGMFCGGHNNQQHQQGGAPGQPNNQRQGFSLNFFRNFSFSGQQQPTVVNPGTQPTQGGELQPQGYGQPAPATNLAAVGSQLLSSIEYRQNQGLSLNLGNLVNGMNTGDVYTQLQHAQLENAELKERLSKLEQERETYTLPAVNIGIDFEGYQTLVEQVNAYCKEFKAELTQAQLDYVHQQLKQAFEDRLTNLFKEIKFNTQEELDQFLSQSTKTLSSLKAVHSDLAARLKDDSGVLEVRDKQRLLEPLEQQISSLERRILFFSAERPEEGNSEALPVETPTSDPITTADT